MARQFKYILATLFLGLFVSLMNIDVLDAKISQAITDTIETQSGKNTINVTQKGNGNSISITQSGSNSTTTATVNSSGKKNHTELTTEGYILQTEITFSGNLNRLITNPGPQIQLFSIKNSAASKKQTDKFFEYYFFSNQPKNSIHIHQTSDEVRINPKKP